MDESIRGIRRAFTKLQFETKQKTFRSYSQLQPISFFAIDVFMRYLDAMRNAGFHRRIRVAVGNIASPEITSTMLGHPTRGMSSGNSLAGSFARSVLPEDKMWNAMRCHRVQRRQRAAQRLLW